MIEVICGPMFSGKTEELLRRAHRVEIAKKQVQLFKPLVDGRFDGIGSHNNQRRRACVLQSSAHLQPYVEYSTAFVGIDEIQFFDEGIIDAVQNIGRSGITIVVAGLDMDYKGQPFEITAKLLAVAESITKLSAVCVICGEPATRTYRKTQGTERIEIGAAEAYEARCLRCFHGGTK